MSASIAAFNDGLCSYLYQNVVCETTWVFFASLKNTEADSGFDQREGSGKNFKGFAKVPND